MTPGEREEIRTEICAAISEMLDNPDRIGIYPTTRCFNRLEQFILAQVEAERERCARIAEDFDDYSEIHEHRLSAFTKDEIAKTIRRRLYD